SGRCPGRTDAMVRITSPRVQKTKPEKLIDAALMGGTLNARASYLPETLLRFCKETQKDCRSSLFKLLV
ncbi:MAG: hypothetical protein IKG67_15520, partial [Parasporobacterium sp.]|nr:hypothetical protein [Parasporobacterium sp.]